MLGIDITSTQNQYKNRGIGVFTKEITERFINEFGKEVLLFGYKGETTIRNINNGTFAEIYHSILPLNPITKIQSSYYLNLAVKKSTIDKFFSPFIHSGVVYTDHFETYVFIHDMIQKELNNYSSHSTLINIIKSFQYNSDWSGSKRAKKIITNSNTSKASIMKYIRTSDIEVVYLGVNKQQSTEKFVSDRSYILYFGGSEINKNVDLVIKSFLKYKESFGGNEKLLIIGSKFESIQKSVLDEKHAKDIYILGFVNDKEKTKIVNGASIYINLSSIEGFGLSVLESLNAGVPCIISNIPIYKELFNECALFVDLLDEEKTVEQVSISINKFLKDKSLRQLYIDKGKTLAEQLSWDSSYKKISSIILNK